MKAAKYFFIPIFLVLVTLTILSAAKKPDDSDWYASTWDYGVKNGGLAESVPVIFKAIEIKHQTEFAPAIIKYLDLNQRYNAEAIYTLHQLGVPESVNLFNQLLSKSPNFNTTEWLILEDEKQKVLVFMRELALKPDQSAITQLKRDISELVKQSSPRYTLPLITAAKPFGIELSESEKQQLIKSTTKKWRNANPFDLKACGIQLDWLAIIDSEKEAYFKTQAAEAILVAGDNDSYKKFINWYDNIPQKDPDSHMGLISQIMKASLGDQSTSNELSGNPEDTFHGYRSLASLALDRLPNPLLAKTLETKPIMYPRYPQSWKLLNVIEDRGYKSEVDNYLKKAADETTIMKGERFDKDDFKNFGELNSRLNFISPIAGYDGEKYMDLVWQLFEKLPENEYLAFDLIFRFSHGEQGLDFNGMYKWVEKNPGKFAQAIETVLEQPVDKNLNVEGSLDQKYFHNDDAISAMVLLPDSVFEKYFKNLDEKYFTKSAFLTGNYFKAKWAYKKDQAEFYKRYDAPKPKPRAK